MGVLRLVADGYGPDLKPASLKSASLASTILAPTILGKAGAAGSDLAPPEKPKRMPHSGRYLQGRFREDLPPTPCRSSS